MARGLSSSLLSTAEPCTVAPGSVSIGHVQLRDVLICPHDKGIVSYASHYSIVEHDVLNPHAAPRKLVELTFTPNTIAALNLPDTNDTLLAAGGQEAELHLSYYQSAQSQSSSSSTRSGASSPRGFGRRQWESKYILEHASINNSVMLTSMSFSRSNESAAEPRILVSNNDRTVKFYDVAVRSGKLVSDYEPRLLDIGQMRLDVPINHSSVSPDGRTLLCVGDSPDVYLHRIKGGSRISFTPIAKLSLEAHIQQSHSGGLAPVSSVPASFSTSFSADGSKFAVASQEGVVVVWDVRSTKPLKVFHTDKSRTAIPSRATGSASGWLYDLPWDWSRSNARAPGWGVRSVKFSPPGVGKEVMTFTEHTSLLHVVDARTFETEEIVRVPNFETPAYYPPTSMRPRSTSPVARSPTTVPASAPDLHATDPRRLVLFSGPVEETFRIPVADNSSTTSGLSGWRARMRARRVQSRRDRSPEEDPDNIVVIPPLGDREVDNNVRRLLGRRSSRTTLLDIDADPREPLDGAADEAQEGDEMDVDELENDCLSSHAPSRAGSPAPASQLSLQSSGARPLELLRSRPTLLARRESGGPYATGPRWGSASSASSSRRPRPSLGFSRERGQPEDSVGEEQDIAGMCFDPSGTFVYVASAKGIAEWRVRGAEQRWWTEPQWA
ncbi:WD40-repeat-containing domain protein [Trametes elegans]|nr:WD40-repeat-containing domain protein [Trametes elegans]